MRSFVYIATVFTLLLVLDLRGMASGDALPAVTNLTSVQVCDLRYLPPARDPVIITNTARLQQIADFINARTNRWEIRSPGSIQVPPVLVVLYSTDQRQGAFGAGKEFFQRGWGREWFGRMATRKETEEFLRLIQMPLDSVDSAPNKPANQTLQPTRPRLDVSYDP
jgi:hypothetical protein